MSDIIHLLPDSVANQIAAGEVIQRPASVLKELVENAIDAGATFIQIVIKDAGRTLIQVWENGKGMSETDARMAFERHATSKIREASDLKLPERVFSIKQPYNVKQEQLFLSKICFSTYLPAEGF